MPGCLSSYHLGAGAHHAPRTPYPPCRSHCRRLSSSASSWSRSCTVRGDKVIVISIAKQCSGVYFLIFIQCMRVLRRRQSRPGGYLLGTAVSLFVLVTAVSVHRCLYLRALRTHLQHLVIDITCNMDAFTSNMGTPNYAVTYYDTFDTWKNIVKSALYVTITIISDAFIVSVIPDR